MSDETPDEDDQEDRWSRLVRERDEARRAAEWFRDQSLAACHDLKAAEAERDAARAEVERLCEERDTEAGIRIRAVEQMVRYREALEDAAAELKRIANNAGERPLRADVGSVARKIDAALDGD